MPDIEVTLTDNTDLIKDALDSQIEAALMAIGMKAETYAKQELTDSGAVDTGRLRNSVTFALAGQRANTPTYKANFLRYKTASGKTAIRRKRLKRYSYKGKAPSDIGGKPRSVYIGSNVEYAAFIEMGTQRMKARPYLRPAATNHTEEYKELVKQALST